MILDGLWIFISVTYFIFEEVDPIPFPSIKSGGMEESSIGITFIEPLDYRFSFVEIFLKFEKGV